MHSRSPGQLAADVAAPLGTGRLAAKARLVDAEPEATCHSEAIAEAKQVASKHTFAAEANGLRLVKETGIHGDAEVLARHQVGVLLRHGDGDAGIQLVQLVEDAATIRRQMAGRIGGHHIQRTRLTCCAQGSR